MKIEIIKDIKNQPYLGVLYSFDNKGYKIVLKYIRSLLSTFDKTECLKWIDNQQLRDKYTWHITVFNSMECRKYSHLLSKYNGFEILDIEYKGIGSINDKNGNKTFYIICSSSTLDKIIESENIDKKHFHITIAFTLKDLFNENKDISTKIETIEPDEYLDQNIEIVTFDSDEELTKYLKNI